MNRLSLFANVRRIQAVRSIFLQMVKCFFFSPSMYSIQIKAFLPSSFAPQYLTISLTLSFLARSKAKISSSTYPHQNGGEKAEKKDLRLNKLSQEKSKEVQIGPLPLFPLRYTFDQKSMKLDECSVVRNVTKYRGKSKLKPPVQNMGLHLFWLIFLGWAVGYYSCLFEEENQEDTMTFVLRISHQSHRKLTS